MLETFLGKTADTLKCNPAGQVDPSQFGQPVPFLDRRPLPSGAFVNVNAVYQSEGATHYWWACTG